MAGARTGFWLAACLIGAVPAAAQEGEHPLVADFAQARQVIVQKGSPNGRFRWEVAIGPLGKARYWFRYQRFDDEGGSIAWYDSRKCPTLAKLVRVMPAMERSAAPERPEAALRYSIELPGMAPSRISPWRGRQVAPDSALGRWIDRVVDARKRC
jgi:hypothetical protein